MANRDLLTILDNYSYYTKICFNRKHMYMSFKKTTDFSNRESALSFRRL